MDNDYKEKMDRNIWNKGKKMNKKAPLNNSMRAGRESNKTDYTLAGKNKIIIKF